MAELQFDKNGWLQPAGCQLSDEETVRLLFVTNDRRTQLWNQFAVFMRTVREAQIKVLTVWLDGSFISQKLAPNDLDAVLFVDTVILNTQFTRLDNLRNLFPDLDVYWASFSEDTDELSLAINAHERIKWDCLFGMTRFNRAKGYIQLID